MNTKNDNLHGDVAVGSTALLGRIGRFRISRELLRRNPAELLALFAEMVVVEAQMRWEYDCIEYVALSERFEEQPENVAAPLYKITFRRDEKGQVGIQSVERDTFFA